MPSQPSVNKNGLRLKLEALTKCREIDVPTITTVASIFFIAFTFLYANLVFIQFSFIEISKVFISFFLLLSALVAGFNPWVLKIKPRINRLNIFWSIFVFLGLVAVLYSSNPQFFSYYRTFPLLEAEMGLGWHHDSAFHVSIINSLVNFGYPSIGQHGTPIIVYHVLSHLVDSIILRIVQIDAWDSYGLFFYFKKVIFLLSLLWFIATVNKERNPFYFVISLALIIPIAVGTWHAVGSHGLWFISIILVLSSPTVFRLFKQEKKITFKNLLFLGALLVTISLGKISSGFSYAVLIGLILLSQNYKNYKIYAFGILLVTFFTFYGSLFGKGQNPLYFPSVKSIASLLLHNQLAQVYVLIIFLSLAGWLLKSKTSIRIAAASLFASIALIFVLSLQPHLSPSDIWYFIYGISSPLILLAYQAVTNDIFRARISDISDKEYNHNLNLTTKGYVAAAITGAILINTLNMTNFNLLNINAQSVRSIAKNLYDRDFDQLNKIEPLAELNVKNQLTSQRVREIPQHSRPLYELKLKLERFLTEHNLDHKNSLLYIPKEIYKNEFKEFKGSEWAAGMLVYAITGIPQVHGLQSLRRTYGYSDYDRSALWVSRLDFERKEACQFNKKIILVESIYRSNFTLIRC